MDLHTFFYLTVSSYSLKTICYFMTTDRCLILIFIYKNIYCMNNSIFYRQKLYKVLLRTLKKKLKKRVAYLNL